MRVFETIYSYKAVTIIFFLRSKNRKKRNRLRFTIQNDENSVFDACIPNSPKQRTPIKVLLPLPKAPHTAILTSLYLSSLSSLPKLIPVNFSVAIFDYAHLTSISTTFPSFPCRSHNTDISAFNRLAISAKFCNDDCKSLSDKPSAVPSSSTPIS